MDKESGTYPVDAVLSDFPLTLVLFKIVGDNDLESRLVDVFSGGHRRLHLAEQLGEFPGNGVTQCSSC